jgi:hypothetical protein
MASGFHLSSIGEVETKGQQISHWWYSGSRPTLRGEGLPGNDVTVSIDGNSLQTGTDSAGEWVFTPAENLATGDHQIVITSNGSEIKFTLTVGAENVNWEAVESGNKDTLPTVGVVSPTVLLLLAGIGLWQGGIRIWRSKMV